MIQCPRMNGDAQCPNEGAWVPRILVPAMGYTVIEGDPATLMGEFDLRICDVHKADGVEYYLTPEGKARIEAGLQSTRPRAIPPDWSKAIVRFREA